MLVSFVGSPLSGKTTTAAALFAKYKEDGIPCDFLAEQARLYIAKKRYSDCIQPHEPVTLTDFDQCKIYERQLQAEHAMKFACGPEVIVVSDSCALNSLLYLQQETIESPNYFQSFAQAGELYDLVFLAHPIISYGSELDPNRIHSHEERMKIHSLIEERFAKYAPNVKLVPLLGRPVERLADAMRIIGEKYRG